MRRCGGNRWPRCFTGRHMRRASAFVPPQACLETVHASSWTVQRRTFDLPRTTFETSTPPCDCPAGAFMTSDAIFVTPDASGERAFRHTRSRGYEICTFQSRMMKHQTRLESHQPRLETVQTRMMKPQRRATSMPMRNDHTASASDDASDATDQCTDRAGSGVTFG